MAKKRQPKHTRKAAKRQRNPLSKPWVSPPPSQPTRPAIKISVVSLNFRDEVLSAEYHKIRASQGTTVP